MSLITKTNYKNTMEIEDSKVLTRLLTVKDPTKTPPTINQNFRAASNIRKGFSSFNKVPYDFTEIYRILDTESYVASAFRKKRTLILKDGFKLVTEKEKDLKYLKKRLEEFHYVTGISFKEVLEELTTSFVNNHNAFLLPVRKQSSSSGNTRRFGGRVLQPIAGFFVIPETKMEVLEDEYGLLVGYKYKLNKGQYKIFKVDEIKHLKMEVKPGYNIGTPAIEAVVDDLLALRQIEESLERLIYKLSTPIIHAKVGTEDKPAGIDRLTGEKEVDQLNNALQHLEDAGGITTSERVEFKMLGAESQALRLSGYLEYFKNRVLVGLSISDLDLGVANSTSAGSSATVTKALQQNVELYQKKIQDFITDELFPMILLESDQYSDREYLEEEEKIIFSIVQSNIEDKIKIESHYMNEYNNGLITQAEYRLATGKRVLTSKEVKEIKEFKNPTTVSEESSQPSKNTTDNITTPKNQHSIKEASEDISIKDSLNLDTYVTLLKKNLPESAITLLYNSFSSLLADNNLVFNIEDNRQFISKLTTSLQSYIIGTTTTNSSTAIAEKLICKKIIEIVEENVNEQDS